MAEYSFGGSAADYGSSIGGGGKFPVAYMAYRARITAIETVTAKSGNPVMKIHLESDEVTLSSDKMTHTFNLYPNGKNFGKELGKFAYAVYASAGVTKEALEKISTVDPAKTKGQVIGIAFFPDDLKPQFSSLKKVIDINQVEDFNDSWESKREQWVNEKEANRGSSFNSAPSHSDKGFFSGVSGVGHVSDDDLPF